MRRKPILILCTINAAIAAIVLIICLPRLLAKPSQPATTPNTTTENPLTDRERWAKVLTSSNEREAAYYLSQIEDTAFKQAQLGIELRKLQDRASANTTTVNDLRRNSTFISAAGQLAETPADFNLLISVFKKQTLSITLREAVLRSCIEAAVRLNKADDSEPKPDDEKPALINRCCELIDQAYTEKQTSLAGLALQADQFLKQNDMLPDDRHSIFLQNLKETLTDAGSLQSNQLACMNILNAPANYRLVDNATLFNFYQSTRSDALKEATLTLLAAKKDPSTETWLLEQTASSPKLEQLQLAAIEALQISSESRDPGAEASH